MSSQDYVNDHQVLLATELVDDDDLIATAIKSITKDVRKRVQPTRAYHETSDALAVVDHFYRGVLRSRRGHRYLLCRCSTGSNSWGNDEDVEMVTAKVSDAVFGVV